MWPLVCVRLFALPNGPAEEIGTATVSEAGVSFDNEAVRRLHTHDFQCKLDTDLVFIKIVEIEGSFKYLAFPYTSITPY